MKRKVKKRLNKYKNSKNKSKKPLRFFLNGISDIKNQEKEIKKLKSDWKRWISKIKSAMSHSKNAINDGGCFNPH